MTITPAASDFDFIAKRLREIQEEKERARQQQEQQQGAAEPDDDIGYGFFG